MPDKRSLITDIFAYQFTQNFAKKTHRSLTLLFFLLFIILSILPAYVSASDIFDLSYTLTEGGYRLELDSANLYKGVSISVTSNVATRYEVVQKIIAPLENRDRPGTVITDNLVYRAVRGTNKYGNFRISANDTPVRADEILYVSNTAGDADTFTLVYGLSRIEDLFPGDYYGRISFTLNPVDSGRSQVTKILEVHVTISAEAEAKAAVEIVTAGGSKIIPLSSNKDKPQAADVLVKINGKFKRPFSIMQFLSGPFESREGNQLDYATVNFTVKDARKGVAVNRATPLSSGMQNIYVSLPSGEADDNFVIGYNLEDLSGQKAGKYRIDMQYFLEETGVQKKIETLELEVDNERIFELSVTPEDQKYAIEFCDLKPTEPPKKNEVIISVSTNTGKTYQVAQDISRELTNKNGDKISSKYFTVRTESLNTKGVLKLNQQEEVKDGTSVLFVSDGQGSADKFKIIYELECPKDARAGEYSTNVAYSLTEM